MRSAFTSRRCCATSRPASRSSSSWPPRSGGGGAPRRPPGLAPRPPGPAALVPDVVAGSFASRPLLCDLIPHTALNLERHVSPEAVRRYKLASLGAIRDVAGGIPRGRPALSQGECLEFISAMASLAGATWQIANPPPVLAELYAA